VDNLLPISYWSFYLWQETVIYPLMKKFQSSSIYAPQVRQNVMFAVCFCRCSLFRIVPESTLVSSLVRNSLQENAKFSLLLISKFLKLRRYFWTCWIFRNLRASDERRNWDLGAIAAGSSTFNELQIRLTRKRNLREFCDEPGRALQLPGKWQIIFWTTLEWIN